eukprot:s2788_g9.t1
MGFRSSFVGVAWLSKPNLCSSLQVRVRSYRQSLQFLPVASTVPGRGLHCTIIGALQQFAKAGPEQLIRVVPEIGFGPLVAHRSKNPCPILLRQPSDRVLPSLACQLGFAGSCRAGGLDIEVGPAFPEICGELLMKIDLAFPKRACHDSYNHTSG